MNELDAEEQAYIDDVISFVLSQYNARDIAHYIIEEFDREFFGDDVTW